MHPGLQTMTTRDALVAEVRRQILSGELAPGDALTETALSARFGVARPTVRSALQVLAGVGLAQQDGRSLVVPVLTAADVEDMFFVRTPLELEAIRVIIERRLPLDDAEHHLAALEALPDEAGWADRVEAHTAFHIALVRAAGSPRLNRIYPAMQEEMRLGLAQLRSSYPAPQDLAAEHRHLLTVISAGDVARAQQQMRDHLGGALRDLSG